MSKLETNTIDTVSGTTNLTIGGANNTGTTTIKSNNTAAITVDSSQNVGIGTASPAHQLHTYGGNHMYEKAGTNELYTYYKNGQGEGKIQINNSGDTVLGSITNNPVTFVSNNSSRFFVKSNGAINIGDIGDQGTTGSGTLNMYVTGGDAVNINHTVNGNHMINMKQSGTNATNYFYFIKNGSAVGSIYCTTSNTSYNTSSDYRLKENIADITDATTRVKQLQPKRFNFIADADKTVDGFIAHEVSDIVPEAITGTKDAVNEDGSIKPQQIDQAKLVPVLTKALQEAITKIEELETRIQTLENA